MNDYVNTAELPDLVTIAGFRTWLDAELAGNVRNGASDPLAIVHFNVQNFKGYNQHYGFEAGNELLELIVAAIKDAYPNCMASRFGADQFNVATTRRAVVEGIDAVRAVFRSHHKDSSIWLKAGYYVARPGDLDSGVVCDRAKIACDDIRGRRDVYMREYDADLQQKIELHQYVLDHFEEALENQWIKIYYQPIVRVATGEVCDEEALARWVDPIEGLLAPNDFIPVLEEARLIHKLDLYMIRRACENFAKLASHGVELIPVSINLSRADFELCDIVAEVKAILKEHDVPHNMLSIEITESALAGNQEFLKSEVDRFRSEGFEVWIDDFGAGFSSLSTLKDYKFDLVKCDMAFLEGFDDDVQPRIMLAHLISMVKELGLKTLVEGVETSEQLAFLKGIGCGRAQGFLIGRPSSLADSERAIANHTYPNMEKHTKRSFYESVGRVNLIRPNPAESVEGYYIPSDVAAAIVRRRKGRFEYLNTSDLYVEFLEEAGLGSVSEGEAVLNDETNPRRERFVNCVKAVESSDDWHHYVLDYITPVRYMRMRRISYMPEMDTLAVLVVVDFH